MCGFALMDEAQKYWNLNQSSWWLRRAD